MTKFKKITAVVSSVLMAGLTIGSAAAANYPAPFVDDGVANAAIVYGTGAGVSSLDQVQAGNIQASLATFVKGTSTVEGGEVFALEKSSDKMNFNDSIASIYDKLDDDEMPSMLKEGEYDDGDVDTEFTQEIKLEDNNLVLFSDADYNDEELTIGYSYEKNAGVLNYTMDLDDATAYTALVGTDLPLMGHEYYVLAADGAKGKLELLDSASTTVVAEGETVTVDGRTISVIVGDDKDGGWAKFTVDGETVDKMHDGNSEELEDGSWIAVKEVLYRSKEGTSSNVEFTIGSGKLVLENDEEVEMNEEDVDGLTAHLDVADNLDVLTLSWTVDEDSWLTEENALVMPGFETIKVVFGGMNFPEAEKISFDSGDELTLDMENFDLPTFRINSTDNGIDAEFGEENHPLIVQADGSSVNLEDGERFLVTVLPDSNDLSDAETRYYEVKTIENDTDIKVEFEDLIGDNDLTLDDTDSTDEGDFIFQLAEVNDGVDITMSVTSSIGDVSMNKIVTEKGLTIELPITAADGVFNLTESDKDENLGQGKSFTVTVGVDSGEKKLHITDTSIEKKESTTDDVYEGYLASELASKIVFDKSSDVNEFEVEYYGKEVTADVSIASSDAKVSSAGALGEILVKDSEVESVKSKNLVIVGGSCINSAAATVLGGNYCGTAFTEATGVSAGEFLIKGVEDAYTDGKLALVVAGYGAADTANAATFLTKKDVDTSKTYKGTSETEATLVTEAN